MMNLLDRFVAGVTLALLSPLMAVVAALVKVTSPGPVFYRAQRVGMDGQPFTMFKFRTMHVGAAAGGAITASRDPRVFLVGRWLRKGKLDELPQLINVVRGEMAIVGPRPEDVRIVRDHYDAFMRESLTVRPGLTSPGSLHYFADEGALPDDPVEAQRIYLDRLLVPKIALDLVYVRNRTLRYQVELVARTAFGIVGLGRCFAANSERETELAREIEKERISQ